MNVRLALVWGCVMACDGNDEPARAGDPLGSSTTDASGTMTFDQYDWFAVNAYVGVVQLDLEAGETRRLVDGRQPWTHPSGETVFIQGCGERVTRVAIRRTNGLVDILTPCSSELPAREFNLPTFHQPKLSPDGTRVAVEVWHFVDFEYQFSTMVFENGELIAEFDNVWAPDFTPNGRIVMASEGLYIADADLTGVRRIDDNQLNAFVDHPSVHPDGGTVAFQFNQQIWRIELDGSDVQEWVVGSRALWFPTWSPDGETLAYLASASGDQFDKAIYFTDVRSGEGSSYDLTPNFGTDVSVVPNGPLSWRD